VQRTALQVSLLLVVLWLAGIATRSVWTPDEPREFALSVSMLQQPDKAVPLLAGQAFLEKPPLTYWAAATAMSVAGQSAIAARLPNLLYGLMTVLATAWLAFGMAPPVARARTAAVAALMVGTAWLPYLHTVWLATDAPLLAFSALSIAALWHALAAATNRQRWAAYALLHFSLGMAFLSKNILGLLTPLMALTLFTIWERRWRELTRAPFWICGLISIGIVSAWAQAVSAAPEGAALLRVAFWDNSVGRFLPVATSGDYRTGHLNSPGKLLLDVSLEMLPWLFAIAAGMVSVVRRAWQGHATARFLVVSAVPLLLVLSFSSTVRDVYALPVTVPLAVTAALWATLAAPSGWFQHCCMKLTRIGLVGVGLLMLFLALATPLVADGRLPLDIRTWFALAAGIAMILTALKPLSALQTPALRGLTVYACGLYSIWILAAPVIERGQDLRPTARAAVAAAAGREILLPAREETMRAALFYGAALSARTVDDFEAVARSNTLIAALLEVPTDRLTPAMRQRLSRLSASLGRSRVSASSVAVVQLQQHGWQLLADFPNPGGRHYLLLAPPARFQPPR
jgi:4-amino-4-deoxy-L-arabinose transferase-like glycosyltransferase